MTVTEKYVYCLKGRLGFLCDSEWDGDTFNPDPLHAWQYDTTRQDGRGGETYDCVRIKIITHNYGRHLDSDAILVKCSKKGSSFKYICRCARCRQRTKKLVLAKTAIERYQDILKTDCIIKTWEYADEN